MKEIGVKIKEARNKKGLSISKVSTAIKINAKTLQAIEDSDEKNLPAKPFLRGFIQTYARYLELNVDEIMNRFAEEIGTTKPKIQHSNDLPLTSTESHDESQRKIELYKKIGMGTSALVGALLIWGIFKIIGKYEAENKAAREQRQEVLKTEAATAAAAPSTTTPTATVTSATETSASAEVKTETTVAAATQPTTATPTVATETPAPTAAPAKVESPAKPVVVETKPVPPTVTLTPPPTPAKVEVVAKPVTETKPTAPAVPLTPPAPAKVEPATKPIVETKPPTPAVEVAEKPKSARPQEVILEALDSVEIRYQKDGEGEKSMKLQPEKVLVIRAKDKVAITISDGGAINVIHNGKDKGVPGSLGQSVKLSYP